MQIVSSTSSVAVSPTYTSGRTSASTDSTGTSENAQASSGTANQKTLTPQQQRQVAELQKIDWEVRAHEAAHMAAGQGVVTSGASYEYTYGPDGKQYAVGGEVGIDTSPEQQPEDNIEKGRAIRAAALAPRDPSSQDYRVANVGAQLESRGHRELAEQRQQETQDGLSSGRDPANPVSEAKAANVTATTTQATTKAIAAYDSVSRPGNPNKNVAPRIDLTA
jgi:hypothetical protein